MVVVMLTIYCVVDVAQTDGDRVRYAPKWLWALLVIALPIVGPVAWFFFGRPSSRPPGDDDPWPKYHRPQAPDDDENFLKGL